MRKRARFYYWLALPALLGFTFYSTLPALMGVYYSLTKFNGYGAAKFIGLQNFIDLFQDSDVRQTYLFTFRYAIVSTILVNVLSLALAIGLNARIKFKLFLRGVFFLPNVLGLLVVGYLFVFIFSTVLPAWGRSLGIPFLQDNLLIDFSRAWLSIVVVGVWQSCALAVILYLAGLQAIPAYLYEAATIDGAGGWQKFGHVTFPLLAPFFTINIVLFTRNFLGVFDQIVSLTNGGPGKVTESVTFMIFKQGFSGGQFGYQSANAVIFTIIMLIIAFIQLKFLRRREVDM